MTALGRFKELRTLDFIGGWKGTPSPVTAKGLNVVADLGLPHLDTLSLGYADEIDDEALVAVARINSLEIVQFFACNRITGKGIARLGRLERLRILDVLGCKGLSDSDVEDFAALRNVKGTINLSGCSGITSEGVRRLQAALPQCRVEKQDDAWEAIN
jgi:hypothetical protein